jgi:hypothetical protein
MSGSPEIFFDIDILQDTVNIVDGGSGSKKGKANSFDWEFSPKDGERHAPERRLIEMWGSKCPKKSSSALYALLYV